MAKFLSISNESHLKYKIVKWLGRGDEGNIEEIITQTGNRYALKTYHKLTNISEMKERIDNIYFLQSLGVGTQVYDVWIDTDGIGYLVTDVYDITLADYIKENPEKRGILIQKIISVLKEMESLGKFDTDIKIDNVMLNKEDPLHLFFVDSSIVDLEELEPEDISDAYKLLKKYL